MTIKTVSLREINKLSKTTYKVLVMRYWPFWIKNLKTKINEWLKILGPSEQLLNDCRKELLRTQDPRKAWAISKFDKRYRMQILHSSEALGEMRRIKNIGKELKGKRVVYLICHEPTDDYCHRRILKELMERYDLGE